MRLIQGLIYTANMTALNTSFTKLFAYWLLGVVVLVAISFNEKNLLFPSLASIPIVIWMIGTTGLLILKIQIRNRTGL